MTEEEPAGDAPRRRASDRGRYGRLTRERVLDTALALVDRDGLGGLSMRRLGAELGVEAMTLYRYAPGKEALLDGMVEAFSRELDQLLSEGEPAGGTDELPAWERELQRIAEATYQVAMRHPHVVPLLATRLLSTPLARRPAAVLNGDERILARLHEAGVTGERAVAVHRAFTAWLLGYLLVELRAMDDDPDEPEPAFRLGLHRLPAADFPRLRETAPALAGTGGPPQLAAGLTALLAPYR
ncbi:TetR/AcrR family transcriptional regulator [Streptomyces sp. HNM0574]|uniref:TetR/AcrR family transcriptional regulator n=1 Tax=Streptomyces sp. HNM0574 TaxID=2714954 RepID=UPI00146F529E|nr:TetR/AcrR family transcriptional regulator [Streptomyces sp. HNM0574]NLU66138.1 TetR/AcrR family transcriptional regulator [Streptomyces sp. HNM0574]